MTKMVFFEIARSSLEDVESALRGKADTEYALRVMNQVLNGAMTEAELEQLNLMRKMRLACVEAVAHTEAPGTGLMMVKTAAELFAYVWTGRRADLPADKQESSS